MGRPEDARRRHRPGGGRGRGQPAVQRPEEPRRARDPRGVARAKAPDRVCRMARMTARGGAARTGSAGIAAACASIRPERRSPPSALGRAPPCSPSPRRQRLTLAAFAPRRSPARTARTRAPPGLQGCPRTPRSPPPLVLLEPTTPVGGLDPGKPLRARVGRRRPCRSPGPAAAGLRPHRRLPSDGGQRPDRFLAVADAERAELLALATGALDVQRDRASGAADGSTALATRRPGPRRQAPRCGTSTRPPGRNAPPDRPAADFKREPGGVVEPRGEYPRRVQTK